MSFPADAACIGTNRATFFPDGRSGRHAYARARSICQGCQVTSECLEFALANEVGSDLYRYGMFGGCTPAERAAIQLARNTKENQS